VAQRRDRAHAPRRRGPVGNLGSRPPRRWGIEIRYDTSAAKTRAGWPRPRDRVVAKGPQGFATLPGKAVVLACGGFENQPANGGVPTSATRGNTRRFRGSNFNYGDGLRMALEIGRHAVGALGGCHATPINAEAPDYGVQKLTDKTNRLSYP